MDLLMNPILVDTIPILPTAKTEKFNTVKVSMTKWADSVSYTTIGDIASVTLKSV